MWVNRVHEMLSVTTNKVRCILDSHNEEVDALSCTGGGWRSPRNLRCALHPHYQKLYYLFNSTLLFTTPTLVERDAHSCTGRRWRPLRVLRCAFDLIIREFIDSTSSFTTPTLVKFKHANEGS